MWGKQEVNRSRKLEIVGMVLDREKLRRISNLQESRTKGRSQYRKSVKKGYNQREKCIGIQENREFQEGGIKYLCPYHRKKGQVRELGEI